MVTPDSRETGSQGPSGAISPQIRHPRSLAERHHRDRRAGPGGVRQPTGRSHVRLAEPMMDCNPRLAVALLSGYAAETLDLERITAGGATLVPKPVSLSRLLQAI